MESFEIVDNISISIANLISFLFNFKYLFILSRPDTLMLLKLVNTSKSKLSAFFFSFIINI